MLIVELASIHTEEEQGKNNGVKRQRKVKEKDHRMCRRIGASRVEHQGQRIQK